MSIGQVPQSFRGYVGIALEASYGGGPAPQAFIDATSDGFSLDNQPSFQNTTRSRGTQKAEAGPLDDSGSVDLPANPENGIGYLLKAAFGSSSVTASDPDGDATNEVGTHVFSPADALPSLAVEVDRDTDVVRHTGVGVNSLELSHTTEEALTWSADLPAKEPDASVAASTPTYSDLRNFWFQDATATFVGTDRTADLQDLTLTIENNLDGLVRGERSVTKMDVGERVITASATLDFESTTLFEQFLGGANATSPQATLSEVALNATWTSPETIADTTKSYSLEWDMPRCSVNTHEATINQNDLVAEDVEFRALVDSTLGAEAEVTLKNGITSAYKA